jgi:quercetin dioxygenase-like cupin family protein
MGDHAAAMSAREDVQWNWPDALDALSAAPDHHQLLLENESVRVLVTRIPASEVTPVHTHRWPNVQYVVSTSDFVRRDGDGNVQFDSRSGDSRPRGSSAVWSEPLPPHSVENVGDDELHVVMVELKPGAAARRR